MNLIFSPIFCILLGSKGSCFLSSYAFFFPNSNSLSESQVYLAVSSQAFHRLLSPTSSKIESRVLSQGLLKIVVFSLKHSANKSFLIGIVSRKHLTYTGLYSYRPLALVPSLNTSVSKLWFETNRQGIAGSKTAARDAWHNPLSKAVQPTNCKIYVLHKRSSRRLYLLLFFKTTWPISLLNSFFMSLLKRA